MSLTQADRGPYPAAYPMIHRTPTIRVGDVERTRICDALAAHFAAGRLSTEELEIRLGAATTAISQADLHDLLVDLPGNRQPAGVAVSPRPRSPLTGWDALVGVLVAGCCLTTGIMLLGVLFGMGPGIFVLCTVGGTLAALGGAGIAHLCHRLAQRPTVLHRARWPGVVG